MIIELKEQYFDAIYEIMEEAFPIEERRSKEHQMQLFEFPQFHVYGVIEEKELVAFISVWELNGFLYVDHLATKSTKRGSGIGKQLLQEIISSYELVILEVEHPTTIYAKRRIEFYKRLDFQLYDQFVYQQPPFHKGLDPYPLILMGKGKTLEETDLNRIKEELYKVVYRVECLED